MIGGSWGVFSWGASVVSPKNRWMARYSLTATILSNWRWVQSGILSKRGLYIAHPEILWVSFLVVSPYGECIYNIVFKIECFLDEVALFSTLSLF